MAKKNTCGSSGKRRHRFRDFERCDGLIFSKPRKNPPEVSHEREALRLSLRRIST
jgi:hypothetical protein